VIVTNVLEPIFSLNVNTTNFLSQSLCPLYTFSLQVKAKPNEEEKLLPTQDPKAQDLKNQLEEQKSSIYRSIFEIF